LKTTVEALQGTRIKLTVELTAEEVDAAIGDAYSRVAGGVKIPGFRPGKAPRPVIDTYVGRESVLADALEALVEKSYPLALDAESILPVDRPDVGELDGLAAGEPYTFTAELDRRPELKLSSIKDLKVTVPPSKSSDREIDAQLDHLRDRFATLEPVEDRGVALGDFALISFTGTVEGEPYEGNVVDKYLYEVGQGQMPQEFDAPMLGAKPGAEVRAEFPIPESSDRADFVGKAAAFDITVHEIKAKKLPEVDDEFAGNVGGFDTAQQLKDDIRTKLDENKAAGHTRLVEREARVALADRLEGEVPPIMVASRTDDLARDFFETLERQEYSLEKYLESTGMTSDGLRADLEREGAARVRDELALEALAREAGLSVTDEEIDAEIELMASSQKTGVPAFRERLKANGAMPVVKQQLLHRKAVRWLMENVEVVEEEPGAEGTAKPEGTAKSEGAAKPKKKPAAKKAAPKKGTSTTDAPATEDAGAKEE
jgi:trigger factor